MRMVQMDNLSVNLTAAGTRQRVSATDLWVVDCVFVGASGNAGNIYVGGTGVTTTNGYKLDADQAVGWGGRGEILNLKDVWFDGGTTNDDLIVLYTKYIPAS